MSIDLVRRLYDAFNARDVAALRDLCHPEVELYALTASLAGREGPYRGHDGVVAYLGDVGRVWEEMEATPRQVRMHGDEIFIIGRLYARSPALGVRDLPVAWTWSLRDGRFFRGEVHEDPRRAALRAGWLSPPEPSRPG